MMFLKPKKLLEAGTYPKNDYQQAYAHGFKNLAVKFSEGKIQFQVTQIRNCNQKFKSSILKYLEASEKVFCSVLEEIYVKRFSITKVKK